MVKKSVKTIHYPVRNISLTYMRVFKKMLIDFQAMVQLDNPQTTP